MIAHLVLLKSLLSSVHPCALSMSNVVLSCAKPALCCAPCGARITLIETISCSPIGHMHMLMVSPFEGPSGMTMSLSWDGPAGTPTASLISAAVSKEQAGIGGSAAGPPGRERGGGGERGESGGCAIVKKK